MKEGIVPLPLRSSGPSAGRAYYNELDRGAAAWLRDLAKEGWITDGTVDERSISEVQPGDIPARAHFFAGIGGWDLALKLAGWPSDWPVWTGSCPCQPFSSAGKRKGVEDSRHLWPEFRRLIAECRPPTIFGEQVASANGRIWLDGVRADLEAVGYEVGAADLCAAGVSAPHIRQRLYWVAYAKGERLDGRQDSARQAGRNGAEDGGNICGMAHAQGVRLEGWSHGRERFDAGPSGLFPTGSGVDVLRLEHTESDGRQQWRPESSQWGATGRRGADGKWRRIEPGIEPLANGVPGRVGKLRAYGNAIVPQVAAEFIRAFLETRSVGDQREPSK